MVVATPETEQAALAALVEPVTTQGCDDSGIADDSEQEPCFDLSPIKWREGDQSPEASISSLSPPSMSASSSFTTTKRRSVGKRTTKAIAREFNATETKDTRKARSRQSSKSKAKTRQTQPSFELPPLHSLAKRSKPIPAAATATKAICPSTVQSKHDQQMDDVRSIVQAVEHEQMPTMVQRKLIRVPKQAAIDEEALRRQFPQQAKAYTRYVAGMGVQPQAQL